ncbi:pyridoxamine 5'-phosphate oxidase family protein [Sphingorhabdus lacus]|uniref:pyridoxamine 5'-phosphate oxidase family protein n=1 Tax=Sphingorhabdus lacus TaxID=392610 RepID=UPI00359487A8
MTSNSSPPDYYDDLDLSFAKAWDLIEPGANKRTSPAHTPVVGSVNASGLAQLRVMVLREADRTLRRLRFHTDSRSPKVGDLKNNNRVSILMYDAAEKLQLRLFGTARLESNGDSVDAAWIESTTFARRCYLAESAPGLVSNAPTSGLPAWIEGKQPSEMQLTEARANFAILWCDITELEWLYLANSGHRRARWTWDEAQQTWSGRWLIP